MQNSATNPLENFMNAKFLMKDLFGISMNDADFIEKAYRGFRKIGNIATATHAINSTVSDCKVQLPCNVEFIESVSTGKTMLDPKNDIVYLYEDEYLPRANTYYYADILTSPSMNKINISRSQLHPTGQFIPYEICGKNESVKVSDTWEGQKILIIYRGQVLDEDGLPALTPKEVEAIAYYVAFIDTQKKTWMKEPGADKLLAYIKPESEIKLAAAKIPEYVSQNFWDEVLAANTRFDRKQFGSSYKLTR